MFENIGKKIKGLSKIICYIEIAISFIIGVALLGIASEMSYGGEPLAIIGIIILVVGSLFSWIGSFFMYGFGELIDNSTIIRQNLTKKQNNYTATHRQEIPSTNKNNDSAQEQFKMSDFFKVPNLEVVATPIKETHKRCLVCSRLVPIKQEVCVCGSDKFDMPVAQEDSNLKNSNTAESYGLEIFCPECKNDLKFMGYTEDDFKQEQTCPFCNAELKYDKGKK